MLVLATSSGYPAGNLVAIAALAAGALRYGLRALDRRGRRADAAVVSFLPPEPPVTPHSTSGSVAPPGFPEPARAFVPTASSPPIRRGGRSRRDRTTDAIAALVCGVLLVGALVHFSGRSGDRSDGSWDTPQGRQLHAGFVDGCEASPVGARLDCECVFQRLTSVPPGDTPTGFVRLMLASEQVLASGNLQAAPPVFRSAGPDCLTD